MSAALDSTPPPKRRARTRKAAAEPPKKSGAKKNGRGAAGSSGHGWLWKIPLLAGAVLTLLAVVSFDAADTGAWSRGEATRNWIGPAGHGFAWMLFQAFGVSAYGAALMLVTAAVLACTPNGLRFAPLATFGWMLVGTATSGLAHLVADASRWSYPPGGALGRAVGELARGAFSFAGSLILLVALFCMAILLATHFAAARAFEAAARGIGNVSMNAARSAWGAYDRHRRAKAMRADEEDDDEYELLEAGDDGRLPIAGEIEVDADELVHVEEPPKKARAKKEPAIVTPPVAKAEPKRPALPPAETKPASRLVLPDVPPDTLADAPAAPAEPKKSRAKKSDPVPPPIPVETADLEVLAPADEPKPVEAKSEPKPEPKPEPKIVEPKPLPAPAPEAAKQPTIVEPRPPPKPLAPEKRPDFAMANGRTGFHPPSLEEILEGETHSTRVIDRVVLTSTAARLTQKLHDLGVEGEVTEIRPGPVVTMYEFKPAAGIKLSRIASLGDDLAMAMEALRVRIVAPIPGKGVVGFEVPNKTRETVFLKEVVEQEAFQKGASKLTMAIGKDIEGMPYVSDLAKMPHLLIAGTTGSGKSVGVNAMLVSMLMRATPEELRFIMVDPKMLELSIYEGIPHLLLPVVTDPKKAALALRWGVEEMERRYQLLAEAGVRNIGQYNKHVEKQLDDLAKAKPVQMELPAVDEDGIPINYVPSEDPELAKPEPKKLPYIVIVIDELADLMMVAAKEVEIYIARLAQMARAAGIHLMVATQRPSTDVLTGVIKANFPSRISFQVASRHDSGTIINTPGAENLLGMGDMLILPPGTSSLTRVHGAYVSETEINRLTGFWKAQGAPVYDPEILKPRAEDGEGFEEQDEVADELYDQALHAVSDMRFISISLLQRKLRVGYNRAARMIERMEREGVVGPADGAKPREVLIRAIGEMPGE